jgi:hypothetical protein
MLPASLEDFALSALHLSRKIILRGSRLGTKPG